MGSVAPALNKQFDKVKPNSFLDVAGRTGLSMRGAVESKNPKSLNNGLGAQVASENAGNAFNAPQKRKSLI